MPYRLRFRQVHLDFHTSPAIPEIGVAFDKAKWQRTLRAGEVDSITLFSKCHHGWSYHPTKVGKTHPNLKMDLLRAQFDACKEINVNAPIYLSAGIDNVVSAEHPEWREIGVDGRFTGWEPDLLKPGFHKMCFNSPYLDYLCAQIEEVVRLFPDCDGIFLDIIAQNQCCCRWCMEYMKQRRLNPELESDRVLCADHGLFRYYERTTAAARILGDKPVMHNSGHFPRGRRDLLKFFSHLELESLPTGGWGYDHFAVSARYCQNLPLEMLGMTGKFHTSWGEFGGYKHPNALRYECAVMLAYGAKCSVGDQLHPGGLLDETTYRVIGAAYAEVKAKERWCEASTPVADIGVLSHQAILGWLHTAADNEVDNGVTRLLSDGHFLFDLLDAESNFAAYKLIIVPDVIRVLPALKHKLDVFLADGGKLLLSGASGLDEEGTAFLFATGADYFGVSEYVPSYLLPAPEFRADFVSDPFVMYMRSHRIKVKDGRSLGETYDPYFNREFAHFCSHRHAPARREPSGFQAGSTLGGVTYLAHPVFTLYQKTGAVVLKEYVARIIRQILGETLGLKSNLPSMARVTLRRQAKPKRTILHLLYAPIVNRGGEPAREDGTVLEKARHFEIIEELTPLHHVAVSLRLDDAVIRATLEPQGREIPFQKKEGRIEFEIDQFTCHQMVVLQ